MTKCYNISSIVHKLVNWYGPMLHNDWGTLSLELPKVEGVGQTRVVVYM